MSDESENQETTESSSSEEDENAKEWTEEIEKTFLKTLCSLKSKDPKIYDDKVKFFKDEVISSRQPPQPKEKEVPLYLRDYERRIILEKNGILSDEEYDEEKVKQIENERSKSPTYVEEQKILKENFKKLLNDDLSEEEDVTAGFLKVKVKTSAEKAKEEEDYIEWLKGQKDEIEDKQIEGDLKYLRDYWTDPRLSEGEKFLRDYVLNKRYLEPDEDTKSESEVSFSEEKKILEQCDEYEQKYNFRFEEPDKNFIKTYPRVIENSLRRKDETRKRKREELKQRKKEKLELKRLEVKKLKKQKKQELLEKIKNLKELTGNEKLGFDDEDLQKDFNPNEYDKKMSELFNEEFYELNDLDEEKPQFSDSEWLEEYNDDEENEYVDAKNVIDEDEINAEDPNFVMDCDYNPKAVTKSKFKQQTRSSHKKGYKTTKSTENEREENLVVNPSDKTVQECVDEYYGLDFEDIVDDVPVRFKYRKVLPNDFGLSIEEILAADDKELNKWVPMNKILTIRPDNMEKFDKKIYARRANDLNLKKKLIPSLFVDKEPETEEPEENRLQTIKKRKKRRSSKKTKKTDTEAQTNEKTDIKKESTENKQKFTRKRKAAQDNSEIPIKKSNQGHHKFGDEKNSKNSRKNKFQNNQGEKYKTKNEFKSKSRDNQAQNNNTKKSFKNKFANNHSQARNKDTCEIADERLKAYGINPKRYKNKLKYGPK